jgi:hypothetical protein
MPDMLQEEAYPQAHKRSLVEGNYAPKRQMDASNLQLLKKKQRTRNLNQTFEIGNPQY